MDWYRSPTRLGFLYNFLPIFRQYLTVRTIAVRQTPGSLFLHAPTLSPYPRPHLWTSPALSTSILILPFRLSLAPCGLLAARPVLLCCNTTLHHLRSGGTILLWPRATDLHRLSRSGVPCLPSPAGLHLSGRALVSCPFPLRLLQHTTPSLFGRAFLSSEPRCFPCLCSSLMPKPSRAFMAESTW